LNMGLRDRGSDFTFRTSSSANMDKQTAGDKAVQLPTEPSYIRLMDGLSSDTSIELGLRDPRKIDAKGHEEFGETRQVSNSFRDRHQVPELETHKRWNLGHPFLHQSRYGSSSSVDGYPNAPNINSTNEDTYRLYQEPSYSPATPALRRQRSGHEVESVVSPFFDSSHRQAPLYSKAGFAERRDSSRRSDVYQSRRPRMNDTRINSSEPLSLNGLSFFDTPVNSRNEPILYTRGSDTTQPIRSSPYYRTRDLGSRGYMSRSANMRSPLPGDNTYRSSQKNPYYTRNLATQSQSAIPFPSLGKSPYSRIRELPSAMPSIVPERPSLRTQSQWQVLERAGVRSSCHNLSNVARNTFVNPAREVLSRAGRRTVRR